MKVKTRLLIPVLLPLSMLGHPAMADEKLTPESFTTNAKISVGADALQMKSAIATTEPRLGAPGYSWVRIHLYSFLPDSSDMTDIRNGSTASMDKKVSSLVGKDVTAYNHSNAVIQRTVDKDYKVWQMDVAVPGHTCTIAQSDEDVKRMVQSYKIDGKSVAIKSHGSYVCDMAMVKLPNVAYALDVDVRDPLIKVK